MFNPTIPGAQNVMGGMGTGTPRKLPYGNHFISIAEPLKNDNTANRLQYYVYNKSNDDIPMSTAPALALLGVDLQPTNLGASDAPCNSLGYGTGVLLRQGYGRVAAANTSALSEGLGLAYPNPAQLQAMVAYILPSGTKAAALVLREVMTGRTVKAYDLPLQPEGNLQIDLRGFKNGLYAYTLLVDGKMKDTKILQVEK
jgi:hypothetical protein